jgi:hypothetical protein
MDNNFGRTMINFVRGLKKCLLIDVRKQLKSTTNNYFPSRKKKLFAVEKTQCRNSMFPSTFSRETLRKQNINAHPREQTLGV